MVLTLNRQPIIKTRTLQELRKLVFVYASQQAKRQQKESEENQLSWSEILTATWQEMKTFSHNYTYLEFSKTNGTIAKRVALKSNWSDTHEIKGTGRPLKEGQKLYTDAIKYWSGDQYDTGSYYENNLIQSF